jgi:hypothetical protein
MLICDIIFKCQVSILFTNQRYYFTFGAPDLVVGSKTKNDGLIRCFQPKQTNEQQTLFYLQQTSALDTKPRLVQQL